MRSVVTTERKKVCPFKILHIAGPKFIIQLLQFPSLQFLALQKRGGSCSTSLVICLIHKDPACRTYTVYGASL